MKAKKLFKEFNHTGDHEIERHQEIMKQLFKKVGKCIGIGADSILLSGVTIGDETLAVY